MNVRSARICLWPNQTEERGRPLGTRRFATHPFRRTSGQGHTDCQQLVLAKGLAMPHCGMPDLDRLRTINWDCARCHRMDPLTKYAEIL
jgi:hypothetical protein